MLYRIIQTKTCGGGGGGGGKRTKKRWTFKYFVVGFKFQTFLLTSHNVKYNICLNGQQGKKQLALKQDTWGKSEN